MRKLLILASFAAFLLAGCAKTELVSVDNGSDTRLDAIDFTTYTGRAVTKADATDLTESFNVEAFIHSTKKNFFKGTNYTYSASGFTGDTTRYWPTSGNLDFYAVSPLKYTDTAASEQTLSVSDSTFSLTKFNGKTDILGARKMNVAKSNPVAPVALVFNHKLTKVAFKAVGADSTKIYKIDSIVVTANSSSKYNFGASESWDSSSDAFPYVFLGTDKTAHAAITVIPFKTQKHISVGSTYYLIPKQGTVKAKVRYSIYDHDTQIDTTETPIEVTLPVTSWGINKSIVYNLTLNFTSSAEPISFTATVEDWDANHDEYEGVPPIPFSVSATKKVFFTKGNLYWDGTKWHMEADQYDYRHFKGVFGDKAIIAGKLTTTPEGTVGSFFWTKTAAAAYAASYDDGTCAGSDKFFCDGSDAGHKLTVDGLSDLYALSMEEWIYLTSAAPSGRGSGDNFFKWGVSVAGVLNCLVIAPDGYTGTIQTSYDADAWKTAEKEGFVCLPAIGMRGNSINTANNRGYYWSSTPALNGDSQYACDLVFPGGTIGPDGYEERRSGLPVRLVFNAQ